MVSLRREVDTRNDRGRAQQAKVLFARSSNDKVELFFDSCVESSPTYTRNAVSYETSVKKNDSTIEFLTTGSSARLAKVDMQKLSKKE